MLLASLGLLTASAPADARPFARYLGDLPPGAGPPRVRTNPYGTTPQLYDSQGRYRGSLGNNPYDPNAAGNPFSRFGNPYSPYRQDSPNNPYGQGIGVYRYPP
jgi:hypothetical protein